uniref:hypothetical protein n=1 Tax=Chamaesiphon sp. VAR_69_metabat_338 TaxID=2964704 RepID=UPI00286E6FE6
QKIRDEIEAECGEDISERVTFFGYDFVPTWNGFISESDAIIHLYPTMPYRGDLLTLKILAKDEKGNATEWHDKYKGEYNEIMRLVKDDSLNHNLWEYHIEKNI